MLPKYNQSGIRGISPTKNKVEEVIGIIGITCIIDIIGILGII